MNIRDARRRAGLSQQALGERVGLDQSGISRIERGERPMTVDTLKAIASALGVSPAALLSDSKRAA